MQCERALIKVAEESSREGRNREACCSMSLPMPTLSIPKASSSPPSGSFWPTSYGYLLKTTIAVLGCPLVVTYNISHVRHIPVLPHKDTFTNISSTTDLGAYQPLSLRFHPAMPPSKFSLKPPTANIENSRDGHISDLGRDFVRP